METIALADLQSAHRMAIVGPKAEQSAMLRHIQDMTSRVDPEIKFVHVVDGTFEGSNDGKTVPVVQLGPNDGSALGGSMATALAMLASDNAPPPLRKALMSVAGRDDVRVIVFADSECLPSSCAHGCFDAVLFLPGAVTTNGVQRMWRQWIGNVGAASNDVEEARRLAEMFDACLREDQVLVWREANTTHAKMQMPQRTSVGAASGSTWWFW